MPGLTPPGTPPAEGSQRSIVVAAAMMWGVSPKTLWGVYGTESGFGTNLGPSSAGAEGPFQFLPSTAAKYGVDVHDFGSSARGAAHYLHDLGADGNPDSAATAHALDLYSGGGGQDYIGKVKANGEKWAQDAPVTAAVTGAANAVISPLEALGKVGAALLNPNTYFRLGKGALGGTLLILGTGGLVFVVANKATSGGAGKIAKTAVKTVK